MYTSNSVSDDQFHHKQIQKTKQKTILIAWGIGDLFCEHSARFGCHSQHWPGQTFEISPYFLLMAGHTVREVTK